MSHKRSKKLDPKEGSKFDLLLSLWRVKHKRRTNLVRDERG